MLNPGLQDVLLPVPAHLTAKMAVKNACQKDVIAANKMLSKIYFMLEQDRDFPMNIDWTVGSMTKPKQKIIQDHLEAVGYILTFYDGPNPRFIISVSSEVMNEVERETAKATKKQKVSVEDPLPPKYQ